MRGTAGSLVILTMGPAPAGDRSGSVSSNQLLMRGGLDLRGMMMRASWGAVQSLHTAWCKPTAKPGGGGGGGGVWAGGAWVQQLPCRYDESSGSLPAGLVEGLALSPSMHRLAEASLLVIPTTGIPPAGTHHSQNELRVSWCLIWSACAAMPCNAQHKKVWASLHSGGLHAPLCQVLRARQLVLSNEEALPELDRSPDHLCSCSHTCTCFYKQDAGVCPCIAG